MTISVAVASVKAKYRLFFKSHNNNIYNTCNHNIMKFISYKMEMQIAVLKASVQESLKHQLSARGQIGRIKIFCSTLVSQPLVPMWTPSAFIADRPAIVLGL
jgi:hypothetical protein